MSPSQATPVVPARCSGGMGIGHRNTASVLCSFVSAADKRFPGSKLQSYFCKRPLAKSNKVGPEQSHYSCLIVDWFSV